VSKKMSFRGTIGEQLAAVLTFQRAKDHAPDPVKSTWTVVKDEVLIDVETKLGLFPEHRLEITPSIAQIVRAYTDEFGKPDPSKVERNEDGQIVAIGTLRFSDGKQREKVLAIGPDGYVVQSERVMPLGAMLGTSETVGALAGGGISTSIGELSNRSICRELKVAPRKYVPGTRNRRKGRSYTRDESASILAEAYENTPVLPPITKCPPGVASGTASFSAQFIGMKISSSGKGGAPNWVDIGVAMAEQEEERRAFEEISLPDQAVLQATVYARTLKDIGIAAGYSPAYAHRAGGKRALIAANDNYAAALKKNRA